MKNREIKFRAWDKEENAMTYLDFNGIHSWNISGNYKENHDYSELMQYTGFKDKNGKEIYEGDIVKEFDTNSIREIVWRNDLACWNIGRYRDGEVFEFFSFEIIGNIYETPELLNGHTN